MKKINFKNGAAGKTPLNATNLNSLQDNVEEELLTSKTTDIAEGLTITNCAGVNGSLDIKEGKTIQEGTPTPTTPIDIRNVGDNINLFDKDNANIITGNIASSTATSITSSSYTKILYIPIVGGETYTIQKKVDTTANKFNIATSIDVPKVGVEISQVNIGTSTTSEITIITESTAKYLCFLYTQTNTATLTEQEILDSIKIEKGKVATSLSENGCGNIGVKAQNKNKFNKNTVARKGYSSGTVGAVINKTSSTTRLLTDEEIIVKPNTEHTFTLGTTKALRYNIFEIDENNTILNVISVTNNSDKTFTTNANTKKVSVMMLWQTTSNTITLDDIADCNIQLEEGEKTSYAEHQEQTVIFPLSQGQLLHKGDYLAEDGIHQNRLTVIYDGTEEWSLTSAEKMPCIKINGSKGFATTIVPTANCTHFKAIARNDLSENQFTASVSNDATFIFYKNDYKSNLNNWKSYLAEQYANGTPVTVEYELATETITPYTEEQKEVYYQLQHLLMYEGYTSIECIEDIKPDIQVTYLYNNELNKTFGKKIDEVSSDLLNYKLNGDFAVINGIIKEDVTIDYPNGFNRNNCIIVSAMMEKTTEGSRLGYGSVFNSASLLTGGVPIMVSLGANNIQISAKQIVLTSETIIYQNLGTEMNYKIVLMKI